MKRFLEELKKKRQIWKIITKRRDNMIGHMLLKLIIEGYVDGKIGRGRPRMEYISQIMKDMEIGSY